MDEFRKVLAQWYEAKFAPAWWRSWSWRAAAGGLVGVFGPDTVNAVLDRWTAIAALPALGLQAKLWLCVAALVAVVVLRPIAQSNMPASAVAVARFYVPRIVELMTSSGKSVAVAAQVVPVEPGDPAVGDVAARLVAQDRAL